jgi:hypothetical protein
MQFPSQFCLFREHNRPLDSESPMQFMQRSEVAYKPIINTCILAHGLVEFS